MLNNSLKLLEPFSLDSLRLKNRMVMAPLTRNRAGEGNAPTDLNVEYYQQRASAGLIITEATQVSPQGVGYPATPGIHSPEQVEGWKKVTKAVQNENGRIFLQLWHVGRISHPSLQPNGELPVAPSAVKPEGVAMTYEGEKPFVTPRALKNEEISQIVEQYRQGAQNALEAGFDGVEVHSANGYLLDQFLQDGTNKRTDEYGGSLENRFRIVKEVLEAVIEVWGENKVGIRLSPESNFNDMHDSDQKSLFTYVVEQLNHFPLAYVHIIEPRIQGNETVELEGEHLDVSYFRPIYDGVLMTAGGYNQELGEEVLREGNADLVAFGRWFISNPDLPKRFAHNAPLNPYDRSTFYGGDEHGYTDYPFLVDLEEAS